MPALLLLLLSNIATLQAAPLEAPAYPIPQLQHEIQIDGKSDDWQGQGFFIPALPNPDAAILTPTEFTASLRMAWDKRGLLLLIESTGGYGMEADTPGAIYNMSGLELFWTTTSYNGAPQIAYEENNIFQLLIASGRDPQFKKLRQYVYDYRTEPLKKKGEIQPICASTVRMERAIGYKVELLLPWETFELKPAEGLTFGFQIHANDSPSDGPRTQLRWNLPGGDGQRVKLVAAQKEPLPAPCIAIADYPNMEKIRVQASFPDKIKTQSELQLLTASGEKLKSTVTLQDNTATLTLPMPDWGKPSQPLLLQRAGQTVAWLELPDATQARNALLESTQFVFDGDNVFATETFPTPTLQNAEKYRSFFDPAKVKTTFYDFQFNPVKSAPKPGRYAAILEYSGPTGKTYKREITLFRSAQNLDPLLNPDSDLASLAKAIGLEESAAQTQTAALQKARQYAEGSWSRRITARAVVLACLYHLPNKSLPVRPRSEELDWWYQFRKSKNESKLLGHVDLLPPQYEKEPDKLWPTVIFLHGSGNHNMSREKKQPIHTYWQSQTNGAPFILLEPYTESGGPWAPTHFMDWLKETLPRYRVDPARIYLTGFSMGGIATWDIGCKFPGQFAAYIPLASVGDLASVAALRSRPVWVFHGEQDAMPMAPAQEWVEELKALDPKADVKFTALPGINHSNTSEAVYTNPELYNWMFKQSLNKEIRAR